MAEFRFADPAAFRLLWLIPVLLILVGWNRRRSVRLLNARVSARLAPFLLRTVSTTKRRVKLTLQVLTLALFVLALARPQSGESKQKAKSEGLEIMLAVDVSNSMLAEDTRPSRLELAKRELTRLLDTLSGDKVGLVAFAGSAILLSPLTSDKGALKMYIDSLSPDAVATQGTNFHKALSESFNALNRGGADGGDDSPKMTRVIVIASDGEDNEKGGLDTAQKIAAAGIRIFTLGFGTEQGGQIPVRDRQGNLVGYKKDSAGKTVVSKSTGEALRALSDAGRGTFQQVTFGGDSIKNLKANIDQLQRTQLDTMEITHYDEHYRWPLAAGITVALIELFLGDRRREGRPWRGRFATGIKGESRVNRKTDAKVTLG